VSAVRSGSPGEFVITQSEGMEFGDDLVRLVVENGLGLLELRPLVNTLEEIFMKAISSEGN
ncbi:MAG TPA: ABC transporter ATP-binding protein, partial [Thermodesulfobacteriota bacterium]|nr:ABC transporter ATP-binding protein [Thermodesulfobacteriota bacterium]